MYKKILLTILVCCCFSVTAQKLSRTEKNIVKSVESNSKAAISILEEVVNINSGTLNLAGVEKVGTTFAEAFEKIGFETTWIPMPEEMNRAGHLF
ncbi:MAG: M20 family peptidase, partial [Maribacter sp.]